jgi:hypothetical protein
MTKALASLGVTMAAVGVLSMATALPSVQSKFVDHPGWSDCWRLIAMGQAGFSLGLLGFIFFHFMQARIDKADSFIRPIMLVAIAYFLLTLFVGLELASLLGVAWVTWRTPLAFVAFGLSDIGLSMLLVRFRLIARRVHDTDATVRIAITDTSKPGPDIDLENGKQIDHAT